MKEEGWPRLGILDTQLRVVSCPKLTHGLLHMLDIETFDNRISVELTW